MAPCPLTRAAVGRADRSPRIGRWPWRPRTPTALFLARAAAGAMFYRELGRLLHSLDRPSTLRRDQLDCPEVTGQFGSVDRGCIRAGLGSGHVFVGHVEVACVAPRRSPRV